ncbi:hypothetical protein GW17_00012570 [Ensete ventricosum]|nr:hypothetical protein GW17_00012570 [Ensete ventricosum]
MAVLCLTQLNITANWIPHKSADIRDPIRPTSSWGRKMEFELLTSARSQYGVVVVGRKRNREEYVADSRKNSQDFKRSNKPYRLWNFPGEVVMIKKPEHKQAIEII